VRRISRRAFADNRKSGRSIAIDNRSADSLARLRVRRVFDQPTKNPASMVSELQHHVPEFAGHITELVTSVTLVSGRRMSLSATTDLRVDHECSLLN
jgi:hypothetical protein